jgi:hypothetical protein
VRIPNAIKAFFFSVIENQRFSVAALAAQLKMRKLPIYGPKVTCISNSGPLTTRTCFVSKK